MLRVFHVEDEVVAAAAQHDDAGVFRREVVHHHVLPPQVADGAPAQAAIHELRRPAEGVLPALAGGDGGLALQLHHLADHAEGVLPRAGPGRAINHATAQQQRLADAQQVDPRRHPPGGEQGQIGAVPAGEHR